MNECTVAHTYITNVFTNGNNITVMTNLEYVRGYGCDSDILVRNHKDKLIDLFSVSSAKYLDRLHLPLCRNMTQTINMIAE